MSYLMDSSYMHTIRSSPLLMMFAREAILLLKSWCSFSPFFYFYVLFCTMSFRYLSRLYFTLNPISHEAMWCLYCFWSYTVKFDKVEQEKIVEKVSDLPDPVVCNSFFWSNGGFVVFFGFTDLVCLTAAWSSCQRSIWCGIWQYICISCCSEIYWEKCWEHESQSILLLGYLSRIFLVMWFFIVLTFQGVKCKRVARSISSVGLYVPGGTAVLPSTALMLSVVSWSHLSFFYGFSVYKFLVVIIGAIRLSCHILIFLIQPAQIAGCKTVVLATPPGQDGSICKVFVHCWWEFIWRRY